MEALMRTCLFLLTIFFFTIFTTLTVHAVTVYVPSQYPTIQEAIDVCVDGDTVLVADGTYTGDGNRDIDFTGKALVVMSENGPEVTIIDCEGSPGDNHQGLYFNSGEDPFSVVQGFTLTSGYHEKVSGTLNVNSPPITIIDSGGSSSSHHRGFYFHSYEGSRSVVQGFTITHGYHAMGGGIYCSYASPTITGNIIIDNSTREIISGHGGGIYCYGSSPVITDNVISGNSAYEAGGGIFCSFNSNPIITGNTITGNSTSATDWAGGGIYSYASSPRIRNNMISQNTADWGGGIYCHTSTPIITGNTFEGNIASNGVGGGFMSAYSNVTFRENTITGNSSYHPSGGYCGGVACQLGTSTIENNIISGNTAVFCGGIGVAFDISTIGNNLITDNEADSLAGGIHVWHTAATITNNTVAENYASEEYGRGGGIAVEDSCEVTITNAIFWNNNAATGDEISIGYFDSTIPSTLTISYSDVEGGQSSVVVEKGCTLNWGDGMIDEDPLFRDPATDDFHLMAIACGDSLNSPCIDAGDPAINDGLLACTWGLGTIRSDMGAYGGPQPVGIRDHKRGPVIPRSLSLSQNYPNPFNPSTTIAFDLPGTAVIKKRVSLIVYDIRGRRVRTLLDSDLEPGSHKIHWDGRDNRGQLVASGIYLFTLIAGEERFTRKMTILK
jgi:hypothetical protein